MRGQVCESRPDPLVVRGTDAPVPSPGPVRVARYVIGGRVRDVPATLTTEPIMVTQDPQLPPAEQAVNAAVQYVPPATRSRTPVQSQGDNRTTVATPFGPASPLEVKSYKADIPEFAAGYDLLAFGNQRFLYSHLDKYKAHVYVIPDRWCRRGSTGDLAPILGGINVDQMPPSNTFTTSDPNFRPPGFGQASDKWTDGLIAAGVLVVSIVATIIARRWGWSR